MTPDTPIDDAVKHQRDVRPFFLDIRRDLETAHTRSDLTELYKRAGYLIMLIHARSWETTFGQEEIEPRRVAAEEFATTARQINRRVLQSGTQADDDEQWRRDR